MKFVALIMSFLVLALSVMPCADKETVSLESRSNTDITQALHHHDEQEQDDCSPFCHCTCCAGFSFNHLMASINIIPTFRSSLATSFLSQEIIKIALPIWQPPQLV